MRSPSRGRREQRPRVPPWASMPTLHESAETGVVSLSAPLGPPVLGARGGVDDVLARRAVLSHHVPHGTLDPKAAAVAAHRLAARVAGLAARRRRRAARRARLRRGRGRDVCSSPAYGGHAPGVSPRRSRRRCRRVMRTSRKSSRGLRQPSSAALRSARAERLPPSRRPTLVAAAPN